MGSNFIKNKSLWDLKNGIKWDLIGSSFDEFVKNHHSAKEVCQKLSTQKEGPEDLSHGMCLLDSRTEKGGVLGLRTWANKGNIGHCSIPLRLRLL
jgi:hypothetical protein